MEELTFDNYELCGTVSCASRGLCARHMLNVDRSKAKNLYVAVALEPLICCPHFLDRPDKDYPDNGNAATFPV